MGRTVIKSNTFPVNDVPTFKDFCDYLGVKMYKEKGQQLYGFKARNKNIDSSDLELLAEHLAEGAVAIVYQAGHNKNLDVWGEALAVNSKGETNTVILDDILFTANTLGDYRNRFGS